MNKIIKIFLIAALLSNCKSMNEDSQNPENSSEDHSSNIATPSTPQVKNVGAMRDVMWQGKLDGVISLDSIANRQGFYGIGPLSGLRGEILLLDGKQFVSRVTETGEPVVALEENVTAPFFVYANQNEWDTQKLPAATTDISKLEAFITQETSTYDQPFVFKVTGRAINANYHIQNLAEGSIVSSPDEAHAGQRSYLIKDKEITILGFYSKKHKGVFTHHDTNMHLHIISNDTTAMGHLDQLELDTANATLFLPKF